MTAAPKLADDAERALVKPWNDDDAQSIAYNEYNFDPSLLIPANEVPKGHDPNRYWRPNKRQELFLQNPTWEVFYGGQGGGGKALALTTPIATPNGWTTMGELRVGDVVFDERGAPCTVLAATEPMFDHDVFDVVFDDGSVIRADAEHRWFTITADDIFAESQGAVRTTNEIRADLDNGVHHAINVWCEPDTSTELRVRCKRIVKPRRRIIDAIIAVPTEPVRCIKVDSPSHLFLAGHSMIPTHNSDALLIDALRFVEHPDHRALLLRRSFVDLVRYIIPRSQVLYSRARGVWKASARRWHFPSGATIELGACDDATNIHRFAGAAYNWIGWDELTHFTESQYLFMFSRLRSASGMPTYYRAASNPGGPGHDWVLARFAPWLRGKRDQDYEPQLDMHKKPIYGVECEPLYFFRNEDGNEVIVPKGTPLARGRTFIPASVKDNPFLATSEYLANMNAMSFLDRLYIMHGDWLAKPGAGLFFKREWFKNKFVKARPSDTVVRLRYWDLAGTEEERARNGTAWTSGILMSAEAIDWGSDGTPIVRVCIEDIIRGQWHPLGVIQHVEEALVADHERDPNCYAYVERDPGQAGKFQSWFMSSRAASLGQHLRPVQPQGSKTSRARVPSAHAEQGNVTIVESKWNKVFLDELQGFPAGLKDQVDSFTGGFIQLMLLARGAASKQASKPTSPTRHVPQQNIRRGF